MGPLGFASFDQRNGGAVCGSPASPLPRPAPTSRRDFSLADSSQCEPAANLEKSNENSGSNGSHSLIPANEVRTSEPADQKGSDHD